EETMNRRHLVALTFATLIGCATGASLPAVSAQFRPNPAAPRFDQFCESVDIGHGMNKNAWGANVGRAVQRRGSEGFELVSVTSFSTSTTAVVCYKRPSAS